MPGKKFCLSLTLTKASIQRFLLAKYDLSIAFEVQTPPVGKSDEVNSKNPASSATSGTR